MKSIRRVQNGKDEKSKDSDRSRWTINDGSEGEFDGLIVCVGTCGDPMWIGFDGMPSGFLDSKTRKSDLGQVNGTGEEDHEVEKSSKGDNNTYNGPIVHSSELDSLDEGSVKGKTVVVVGSGASGVEAVETALQNGAKKCAILARDDKVCEC